MARAYGNPQALLNSALKAFQIGDLVKAERQAGRLSKMFPEEADCWNLRAQIATRRGSLPDAIRFFRKAVTARPNDASLWNNLGNALQQSKAWEPAIEAYRQSLHLRPESIDTASNLGNALIGAGLLDEAEALFRSLLANDGRNASALVNLSYVLTLKREPEAVVALLHGVMQSGDLDPSISNNFATNLAELGLLDESAEILARGLTLMPDDPYLRFKYSVVQMLRGDWSAGWRDFDARWAATGLQRRPFGQPLWRNESLDDKTSLVWGEQGIGDEVMLASMIPDLLARAGKVIVECDPRLAKCFRRSFEGAVVEERTDPPAASLMSDTIDYQVPAGDLGLWLRPDEASFPPAVSYLKADPGRTRVFHERYGGGLGELLVGVTWRSGNPTIGDVKSLHVTQLRPIFEVPGCRFVNLQYGDTADDMAALRRAGIPRPLIDSSVDPVADFDGHMAQIAAMDLVISVSNSTVHAAGAIGIPTRVMLRHVPDRRWLIGRDDTPWYHSVRLYRQKTRNDWSAPISRAAEELRQLVGSTKSLQT
jgi:tetratricopeptide (TPR) repeat protein